MDGVRSQRWSLVPSMRWAAGAYVRTLALWLPVSLADGVMSVAERWVDQTQPSDSVLSLMATLGMGVGWLISIAVGTTFLLRAEAGATKPTLQDLKAGFQRIGVNFRLLLRQMVVFLLLLVPVLVIVLVLDSFVPKDVAYWLRFVVFGVVMLAYLSRYWFAYWLCTDTGLGSGDAMKRCGALPVEVWLQVFGMTVAYLPISLLIIALKSHEPYASLLLGVTNVFVWPFVGLVSTHAYRSLPLGEPDPAPMPEAA